MSGDLTHRIHKLTDKAKPTVPGPMSPMPVTTITSPSPVRAPVPQLQILSFSGDPLHWTIFWTLFSMIMSTHLDLPGVHKTTLLIGAMSRHEDVLFVSQAAGETLDYNNAVIALHERHEVKRLIFNEHFKNWSVDKLISHRSKDISEAISEAKDTINGFLFCRTCTMEHLMAAKFVSRLTDKLYQKWQDRIKKLKILLSFEQLCQFLEGEMTIAPRDDFRVKPAPLKPTQLPSSSRKAKVHVLRTEGSRSSGYLACKGKFHPLFTCEGFKAWDVSRHQELVRTNCLCNNCLSGSHSAHDCSSFWTCKHCGGKRHSLLHRSSPVTSVSPSTWTPTTSAIDSVLPSANVSVVQLPMPTSLYSTALVSAVHGDLRMTARALLDQGATISLITGWCRS